MVVYSIKDIEKLTGVKAHTIRIWEKRYAIVMPKRTKTNIRFYDEEDLKNIMNIALLNNNGYKISNIAKLALEERFAIAAKLNNVDSKFENSIDAITYSVLQLDEHNINLILNQHILQKGLENTMQVLVNPLLEKMGMMWISGSVTEVHEKFLTNLLKNVIIGQINATEDNPNNVEKTKVLLYLPEGQSHELSLLYIHYMLKSQGFEVLMFGTSLSLEGISNAVEMKKIDKVVTIINENLQWVTTDEYIDQLSYAIGPEVYAVVTGYEVIANLKNTPANVFVVQSVGEILTFEKPASVSTRVRIT